MRLTKKSKYAARAVVEIALSGRGPLVVAEIVRRQSIPERFLEQIFGELRRGGILKSRRGAYGGHCLAIPAERVRVLDIVEILDGEARPAGYLEGGGHDMDDAPPCSTSKVWDEARVALEGVFNGYSIAQLAEAERGSREERERASEVEVIVIDPDLKTLARAAQPLSREASGGGCGTEISRERSTRCRLRIARRMGEIS